VRSQRLVRLTQVEQGVATIRRRGPVAQRLRAREGLHSLGKPASGVQQDTLHIHGFIVFGIARQGPAHPSPCAGPVPSGLAELRPGHVGFGLFGIQRKSHPQVLFGVRPSAIPLQQSEVDPSRDHVRLQLDRSPERTLGSDLAPLFPQQTAKVHPGRGKTRPLHQGTPVADLGVFGFAQSSQCKPGCEFALGQPRAQGQRLFVAIESFIVALHPHQRMPEAEVGRYQRRVPLQSQFVLTDCLFGPLRGESQLGQAGAGSGIHAVEPDGFSKSVFCLVVAMRGLESVAQRDPGRAHLRRCGSRSLSHQYGLFRLMACQRHQAHPHKSLGMARIVL